MAHFQKKISVGLGILFVLICPFSYQAFLDLKAIDQKRVDLTERYARALALINHLKFVQAREDSLFLSDVLTHSHAQSQEIQKLRQDFKLKLTEVAEADPHLVATERLKSIGNLKLDLIKEAPEFADSKSKIAEKLNQELDLLFEAEMLRFTDARLTVDENAKRVFLKLSFFIGGILSSILGLFFFVLKRIHQKKTAHAALEQIADERKALLETVSHDLKSPLTAVELSLRMIERGHDAPRHLSTAFRALHNMQSLIESLLDDVKVQAKTSDLISIVEDAVSIVSPLAIQKNIQIKIKGISACKFSFDEKAIHQVLSNLLSNAVKFTPHGGQITVSVTTQAQEVLVSVTDSGCGIHKNDLHKVFDRLWQAEAAKRGGTGLGLAISRKLIEKHRGQIFVSSELERGSTFSFQLPRT